MSVEPKSNVKCINPRYFKKCHIKERCTSVWSAQSIVLPNMPKWLMRTGLYLELQPARKISWKSNHLLLPDLHPNPSEQAMG